MRYFKYIVIGFIFGVTMFKSEAVSWYRIFEMFHFQSFHMYGIIMVAVLSGFVITQVMKRGIIKTVKGEKVTIPNKSQEWPRYIIGGTIFGMGWALGGVCPGPMFVLLGAGWTVFAVFLASAMLGTFVYGLLRHKLPH
jgi:uncharacterized protein